MVSINSSGENIDYFEFDYNAYAPSFGQFNSEVMNVSLRMFSNDLVDYNELMDNVESKNESKCEYSEYHIIVWKNGVRKKYLQICNSDANSKLQQQLKTIYSELSILEMTNFGMFDSSISRNSIIDSIIAKHGTKKYLIVQTILLTVRINGDYQIELLDRYESNHRLFLEKTSMRSKQAFTLIELLIVVAIIAILAAIAVPNFLEAQTRSKISRAQADMRSTATSIEAYMVDHNRYPFGYVTIRQAVNTAGMSGFPASKYERNPFAQSQLTTPIAYQTTIFTDPFTVGSFTFDRTDDISGGEPFPYWYDDYQEWSFFPGGYPYSRFEDINNAGYAWSLSSAGPEKSQMMMWYALDGVDPASANNHIIFAYDATNGTVSEGFIARTNKGVFTEVNQE